MALATPAPSAGDPSSWPLHAAARIAVGHDFGYSADHSAFAIAGMWRGTGGGLRIGVTHLERLPLNTPPSHVAARFRDLVADHRYPNAATLAVVDSRSNAPHFHTLVARSADVPVIGVSLTGSERDAAAPEHQAVPVPETGRMVHAPVWSLGRKPLLDGFAALLEDGPVNITTTGDAEALRAEMAGLTQEVTAARNVRYVTASGGHDDLLVSAAMALWALRFDVLWPRRRAGVGKSPRPSSAAWT